MLLCSYIYCPFTIIFLENNFAILQINLINNITLLLCFTHNFISLFKLITITAHLVFKPTQWQSMECPCVSLVWPKNLKMLEFLSMLSGPKQV